jgi:mRNA interferase YafQ
MIYEVIWTNSFKKGYKRCQKRGLPLEELKSVVEILRTDQVLDAHPRGHGNAFRLIREIDTSLHFL